MTHREPSLGDQLHPIDGRALQADDVEAMLRGGGSASTAGRTGQGGKPGNPHAGIMGASITVHQHIYAGVSPSDQAAFRRHANLDGQPVARNWRQRAAGG